MPFAEDAAIAVAPSKPQDPSARPGSLLLGAGARQRHSGKKSLIPFTIETDTVFGGDTMAEQDKGFTVRDRRFSSQEPEEAPAEAAAETAAPESGTEPEQPAPDDGAEAEDFGGPLPQINFATFVFSLNSSALVHLGAIEEPGTGKKVKNLPLAKQTIDILGILEEKTRGNLTSDEDNLLKNILHDLRIMYVREKK